MQKTIITVGEDETRALGLKIAAFLEPGMKLYLSGELGAGKTSFVKGVAMGLGIQDTIKSPTYTLLREYHYGHNQNLFHFDFYRLEDDSSFDLEHVQYTFGLPSSICICEWPERLHNSLPEPDCWISFRHISDIEREITVKAPEKSALFRVL